MSDVQIKHVGHVWAGQLRQVKFAAVNHNGATEAALVAAVPGKKIRVLRFFAQAAGTTPKAIFYSGPSSDADPISGVIPMSATAGTAVDLSSEHGLFETDAGDALYVDLTGNADNEIDGFLVYVEV